MTTGNLTVGELMRQLEAWPRDAEVRIAHQPSWPFQYAVRGLVADREISTGAEEPVRIVWIVEGRLIGEFSAEAWRVAVKKSHT